MSVIYQPFLEVYSKDKILGRLKAAQTSQKLPKQGIVNNLQRDGTNFKQAIFSSLCC
jgi:hypothetical protein